MKNSFDKLKQYLKSTGPVRVAVAAAADASLLEAVIKARREGYIEPILTGDVDELTSLLLEILQDGEESPKLVQASDKVEASQKAVGLVRSGDADLPMKGLVDTSIFLRAVIDRDNGIRGEGLISHVNVFEVEDPDKLLIITDAALNISPTVEHKVDIINNALALAKAIDIDVPKVAMLCPVEKENDKIESTLHAVEIQSMWKAGKFEDCVISGPLALDNVLSKEAAKIKGIEDPVAGEADIIIVHNLEVGNVLVKAIEHFSTSKKAGVIVGAKVPVVLTSRASSVSSKLNSIVVAAAFYRASFADKA